MLSNVTYESRRHKIARYFDKTATAAWAKLTSDAPVSFVRQSVRDGREEIKSTILSWLPDNLVNTNILDAGCGTGSFAFEAAKKGAKVTGVDISPSLIKIARSRMAPSYPNGGTVDFYWGDMLNFGEDDFDHVVLIDSIIHYDADEVIGILKQLGKRCKSSMIFTFAPHNKLLGTMISIGKFFPKSDRAPSIVPMREREFFDLVEKNLSSWKIKRVFRVSKGFYTSQAVELVIE